jgi:hypothetical protein
VTGEGIADETVSFFMADGTFICSDETNSAGYATCVSGIGPGVMTILGLGYDGEFAGSDTYAPAQAHAGLVRVGRLSLF